MARNPVVVALLVVVVIFNLVSAQGPSAAPAYAPAKSTNATAPTKAGPAPIAGTPEQSTVTAAPITSTEAPSISKAPKSSPTFSDIASPPAPRSEAAQGPTGDFSGPVPIADTPAESPQSAGAALKVFPFVGVAATVGSLLF